MPHFNLCNCQFFLSNCWIPFIETAYEVSLPRGAVHIQVTISVLVNIYRGMPYRCPTDGVICKWIDKVVFSNVRKKLMHMISAVVLPRAQSLSVFCLFYFFSLLHVCVCVCAVFMCWPWEGSYICKWLVYKSRAGSSCYGAIYLFFYLFEVWYVTHMMTWLWSHAQDCAWLLPVKVVVVSSI